VKILLVEDNDEMRGFLERDRIYAAYAICDLDDREFAKTRWGAAWSGGAVISLVLEYSGASPQPIFAMGREDGIVAVLRHVIRPRLAFIASLPADFNDEVQPGQILALLDPTICEAQVL